MTTARNLTAPPEHRLRYRSGRNNLDGSDAAGHLSAAGTGLQMPGFLGRNQQLPLPGTIAWFSLAIQQAGKPY
jgi:hypothetical protein